MNENRITPLSALNPDNIDRRDYTNTLAAEAQRAGLFTESDIDAIRNGLLKALAEIIGYYTKNESSSIMAETARKLTLSMMFNIDTYLLTFANDKRAAQELKERPCIELYGKGYLINSKHFEAAGHLYGKARFTRLKNGGEKYDRMLDKYFRYYLSVYSAKFGAHEKIYLSLPKLGIVGAFNIAEAVGVLEKVIAMNEGKKPDVILNASDTGQAAASKE